MRALSLLLILIASAAMAQDEAGNDTPGDWVVTHHQPFGLWDSMCDERTGSDGLTRRCYVRYVDVFSPRPKFAALFAFITPAMPHPVIEIGIEQGTVFKPDGLRVEQDGTAIWTLGHRPCLFGGTCRFEGDEAATLIAALTSGTHLVFDFIDRHGTARTRLWSLADMPALLADMTHQAALRNLVPVR